MMSGRVLVTGSTGFVGRALAADLAEAGVALTLAVRTPAPPSASPARIVAVGDIHGATEWDSALSGVASAVHLAGLAHATGRDEEDYGRVNRDGSIRLYEAAQRAGLSRFVFVSSVAVLGDATAGRPFDDGSSPDPRSAYARSKLAAEEALRTRALAGGPALTILRPALVCGPGVKGNLATLLKLLDTPLPLPLGAIRNRRTLLPIESLVAAIRLVLAAPPRGPATYLLGDGEPVSTTAIAEALRLGLGRPRRLVPAPAAVFRLAASLAGGGGIARRLLGDLEVDASRFRRDFGLPGRPDTWTSLVATGRAFTGRARPGPISTEGGTRLAG